ncbi:hypothetical protein SESBI_48256 [Sesbania bispinosa]|nr:hypothetical protein SESBI_48256 [Sesbania bispinosa]
MERLDSNQYQGMVEDQNNTSNAPKAKKSVRITTTDNNLERLVKITKSMSKEMRRDFDKMYGRILDLLDISVKTPVISALAQFWSSDLHCFELPNLDLYETQGLSPIPAILADTFLSMEVCQKKNGGALKCCTHLLYVWIITHMYACELRTIFPDPLRDFGRIQVKRQEARGWKKELADIRDKKIAWTCPWFSPYDVIFNCGDFANVPLMGPRGCVAYTPSIALRQLKRTQVILVEEQLEGSEPHGGMSKGKEMTNWGNHEYLPHKNTMSGERQEESQSNVLREAPHGEGSSRSSDETLKAMASELERARAQIKQLKEVEESVEWEIDALKRQCKKKDEQIERLEIQCEKKNEKLSQKVIKRKLKAKRKKQEADEAIEGWRLMTDFQRDKKKEWMKRCDDMADCVNYHSIELVRRLGEAEDEIDRNPEMQVATKDC